VIILRTYIGFLAFTTIWYFAKTAMGWPVDLRQEICAAYFVGIGMSGAYIIMRIEAGQR
jgi:hypothetical protein